MTHSGPIGIFDSGVGGLAVEAAIRRLLPHESILYFADSANFPYGPRPAGGVIRLSEAAARLLLSHNAKLIVVACNTASSAALAALRTTFPGVPFVGMVPAVKPASQVTHTHRIGVLATEGTVQGKVLHDLVAQFAAGVQVERVAAPELAELVEHGGAADAEGEALVRRFVEPLLAHAVDVIVLGCTHFAFLRPQVERLAGPGVLILDASDAIAHQVQHVLAEQGLARTPATEATVRCLTSGDPAELRRALGRLAKLAPGLLTTIDQVDQETPADASTGASR